LKTILKNNLFISQLKQNDHIKNKNESNSSLLDYHEEEIVKQPMHLKYNEIYNPEQIKSLDYFTTPKNKNRIINIYDNNNLIKTVDQP